MDNGSVAEGVAGIAFLVLIAGACLSLLAIFGGFGEAGADGAGLTQIAENGGQYVLVGIIVVLVIIGIVWAISAWENVIPTIR